MLCSQCKKERPQSDFYGKETCYKCTYEEKLAKTNSFKFCKICSVVLPKGKWTYCGKMCSYVAKSLHNKNYWLFKIKTQKVSYRF